MLDAHHVQHLSLFCQVFIWALNIKAYVNYGNLSQSCSDISVWTELLFEMLLGRFSLKEKETQNNLFLSLHMWIWLHLTKKVPLLNVYEVYAGGERAALFTASQRLEQTVQSGGGHGGAGVPGIEIQQKEKKPVWSARGNINSHSSMEGVAIRGGFVFTFIWCWEIPTWSAVCCMLVQNNSLQTRLRYR